MHKIPVNTAYKALTDAVSADIMWIVRADTLYLCIHTPENDFKQPLPQMRNITGGEKNANI